jgi:hypothetical protein
MKPCILSKACRCQSEGIYMCVCVCVYSSTGVPDDDAQDVTFSLIPALQLDSQQLVKKLKSIK